MSILIKGGFVADPANEVASRLNLVLEAGKVADVTSETPDCEVSLSAEGGAWFRGLSIFTCMRKVLKRTDEP